MKKQLVGALLVAGSLLLAGTDTVAWQHGRLFPPEDLGVLEGPDREAWQRPDQIMDKLLIGEGSVVADLGAGGGWFTVRLARRVGPNGRVFAEDIQHQMIDAIRRRVEREGMKDRVTTVLGTPSDPSLPRPVDAVLIVDAYYEMEHPTVLLRNVARWLKPNGRIGIVDFKKDGGGPGPPLADRVDPETVIRDAEAAGLKLLSRETFLRYEFMLVFGRKDTAPAAAAGEARAKPRRR
jgi:ubiquinone/menaquinone biosynthesis C-methylase UbiE